MRASSMVEQPDSEARISAGPIRITIEIDRPKLGLDGARGHMRSAVREMLISLREVLDAGIQTIEQRERHNGRTEAAEKIDIE